MTINPNISQNVSIGQKYSFDLNTSKIKLLDEQGATVKAYTLKIVLKGKYRNFNDPLVKGLYGDSIEKVFLAAVKLFEAAQQKTSGIQGYSYSRAGLTIKKEDGTTKTHRINTAENDPIAQAASKLSSVLFPKPVGSDKKALAKKTLSKFERAFLKRAGISEKRSADLLQTVEGKKGNDILQIVISGNTRAYGTDKLFKTFDKSDSDTFIEALDSALLFSLKDRSLNNKNREALDKVVRHAKKLQSIHELIVTSDESERKAILLDSQKELEVLQERSALLESHFKNNRGYSGAAFLAIDATIGKMLREVNERLETDYNP